jgi:hypothetical protein
VDWVAKGMYWVSRGMDAVADGLKTMTDPRWLVSHPGWAALLGFGVVLLVGWFCLYKGKRM